MCKSFHTQSCSSDNSLAEDVVEVEHAEIAPLAVDDHQLGDAVGAHEVEGVDGILGIDDGLGVAGHDVGGGESVERCVGLNHAAKVTVGDDSLYSQTLRRWCDDNGATQPSGGHLEDGFAHGGFG